MKKLGIFLLLCLFTFILLTYWSLSIVPEDPKISEVIQPENTTPTDVLRLDSVVVIPTDLYRGNWLKRFMQGTNYRKAWEAPIKAPVMRLDSMKILEAGGGSQTHSLDIKSPSGHIYSLRSINKDPDPLIPEFAKTLGLQNLVVDGISAQHPYGAVLAAALASAAGVLHTRPRIVYLPEQEALGRFTDTYGNKLYLLEHETEGGSNWTRLDSVIRIIDTDDLQALKKAKGHSLSLNESALVRARLFDLLIGDWDRHAKQWGWIITGTPNKLEAIPLPGDRDNAFFRIDGVLPTIITNELIQPLVRPFEEEVDYLPGYVYPVDLYFLKGVPEVVFVREARALQERLTDSAIEKALKAWPKPIAALNGEEIAAKLRSRRDDLVKTARAFWKLIQEKEYSGEPLKGSEDLNLPPGLQKCFQCPK